MSEVAVGLDSVVTASEIVEYQKRCGSTGWGVGTVEMWDSCIQQSLCIASGRDKGELVALGFLIGNVRHAEPVDVSVLPEYRNQDLGRQIMRSLMDHAIALNIAYVNLIHDPAKPWLADYYNKLGFHKIDFAMTHERSFNPQWP
jgi:GNAT superfamily N-acetyltransferase